MWTKKQILNLDFYEAALFDLDGVVTRTAELHALAWGKMFDTFIEKYHPQSGVLPFRADPDYARCVDGKPRADGIRDFLKSRGLTVPAGKADDPAGTPTICGLGNWKNQIFNEFLETEGVRIYDTTLDFIRHLRKRGIRTAVVSSSKNCRKVVESAGISNLFDTRVDGETAEFMGLSGKPAPDIFLFAAEKLNASARQCLVIEDALSGVTAAKAGRFGLVIALNRSDQAEALLKNGADMVVDDLSEIRLMGCLSVSQAAVDDADPGADGAWHHTYNHFDPEDEGRRETLCAIGNGYFVSRGAAPESRGDDIHYPGTYLAGVYNRRRTTIAGHTVENEDLVNIPNWRCLNFRIECGEWFSLTDVEILTYLQRLQMKQGVLYRTIRFRDSEMRETEICQQSFVHVDQMHMAGLKMTLTPLNWSGQVEICSAIDGQVENRGVERYQDLSSCHLDFESAGHLDEAAMVLKVRTNRSGIDIAVGVRTRIKADDAKKKISSYPVEEPGYIARCFTLPAVESRSLVVEKTACIYTSRDTGIFECLHEAERTVTVEAENFEKLLESHMAAWGALWRGFNFDIHLYKTSAEQSAHQTIHLYIFHLLQSSSVHSLDIDVGIPARGWHGEGYRGHIFWDELIIFPLLNYRAPRISRTLLMYRYRRLKAARVAARKAGFKGAMFPWQSASSGREETQQMHLNPESGRWLPDNTHLQRHINNAIVYNIWQYFQITQDIRFLAAHGGEIILEIARFWASAAVYDEALDRFEILGVMGPDEYHDAYPEAQTPGINNNAYTNVLVAFVMDQALNLQHVLPEQDWENLRIKLAITANELKIWGKMSRRMKIVFQKNGIISQFEGYEGLKEFDWDGYRGKYGNIQRLDRILDREQDSPNNYKLCKQPDVLMLFYLFSAETLKKMFKRLDYPLDKKFIVKNINYYLNRTTNGSSLALVIHAWIEARMARKGSWGLFRLALGTDMVKDSTGATREGIHLGAMAGCVDILQRGYAGVEVRSDILILNPLLPDSIERIRFHIRYRKHWLDLEFTQDEVSVRSLTSRAEPLTMMIKDEVIRLYPGNKAVVTI